MPHGAPGETAKKKPGQFSKTLPASGTAPGELHGVHPGCMQAPAHLHPALPRADAGPHPASFPRTAGGFGRFAGFLPGCLDRKLRRRVWPFAALHKDWKRCAGERTGERSRLQWAAWVWVSGLLLCCLLFLQGRVTACGSIRLSPEASGLVQKVWSVLG